MQIPVVVVFFVIYNVIFTVRKGFMPKLSAAIRANVYDINKKSSDEETREAAKRKLRLLLMAERLLNIMGWIEVIILVLLAAWLVFIVCMLITGLGIKFVSW